MAADGLWLIVNLFQIAGSSVKVDRQQKSFICGWDRRRVGIVRIETWPCLATRERGTSEIIITLMKESWEGLYAIVCF